MYVVHHNTLSDSFRIWIVWFSPKQDSDRIRISFFKNRIGSESKNPLSDHLWCLPNWKTWQLSTRYRAWQGDFQAWHEWQNFGTWRSHATAFYWNHNGAWNLVSKKLLWIKTFISFFLAAPVPSVFSGVTRGSIKGKNLTERAYRSL